MTDLARLGPLGQRRPPLVSDRLRRSAIGQTCTLRLPCCNHRLDTVVLAHLRVFGIAGMGQKPPDWCACYMAGHRRGAERMREAAAQAVHDIPCECQGSLWDNLMRDNAARIRALPLPGDETEGGA